MGIIPATGSAIKMGGVYRAFTNIAPTGGLNIRLSATLGVNYGGKALGAQISLSATFGGMTTPYDYL